MEKKTWKKSPEKLIELFYSALPADPQVEKRKMFGCPCAFVNGNMFSGLHEDNMIVRLEEKDREEMIAHQGAKPFQPMPGRTMKSYISVPETIKKDQTALRSLVQRSFDYSRSLPIKEKKKRT
jgi:TfoX/Sxy family transcriptional regulator of competence genes